MLWLEKSVKSAFSSQTDLGSFGEIVRPRLAREGDLGGSVDSADFEVST